MVPQYWLFSTGHTQPDATDTPRRITQPAMDAGRDDSSQMTEDRPLVGRHAAVTGAARGIGAAIATRLARLGAAVSLVGRDRAALDAQAGRIDGRTAAFAADVAVESAVADAFQAAAARFGPVDILVNNAGVAESAPFAKTDPALWQRALAVNLTGPYLCARTVVPGMLALGRGQIVNIASTSGLIPYRFVSAYVASKHGLVGLTRALALELADKASPSTRSARASPRPISPAGRSATSCAAARPRARRAPS